MEVIRSKPDLAIKSFTLAKTGVCGTNSILFEFRVTVWNRGTKDSPPTGRRPMVRVFNSIDRRFAAVAPLDSVSVGGTRNVIIPLRYSSRYRSLVSSSEFLKFTVKVDHQHLVEEQNEGNNKGALTVKVPKQCRPLAGVPEGVDALDRKKVPIKGKHMNIIKPKPGLPLQGR